MEFENNQTLKFDYALFVGRYLNSPNITQTLKKNLSVLSDMLENRSKNYHRVTVNQVSSKLGQIGFSVVQNGLNS